MSPFGAAAGMLTAGIGYGGDYNPEQWPREYLTRDIEQMTRAGVTVATLGVFAWSSLEPSPGRYEFDWLERVMDALHTAGISVDLATGTASPPPWMGARYPTTLPVTAEGVTLSWGSRQQYNPSSAIYRERAAALVTELAKRFAHHPALVAWHVNNEYGCHIAESFDEESAVNFRRWLGERYGSLEKLNEAWGTTFWAQRMSTWNEVIPPRAVPSLRNPHHLDDWRRFCSDALLELYLVERDILRTANPTIPITTNFMGLFAPLDYWKWAPHLDFISNDSYPDPANPRAAREFAFECDLMRSLGGGRPFVQMEQVTTAVQWRPRNARKRPGQYRLWSMMAVALGADAILNFQWRQSLAGAEAFHGAMVPHAGEDSNTWGEVVDLGTELASLTSVRGSTVDTEIAIVWDWENAWAYTNAVGPTDDDAPENGTRNWHATLFELGHTVDFVHPDQDLSRYKLVIIPSLFRLTSVHAQRIRDAQLAGVHIIVTYLSGYVDKAGHAVEGGYLGSISDVLGVRVLDIDVRGAQPFVWGNAEPLSARVDRITAHVGAPAATSDVALRDHSSGDAWPGSARDWVERLAIDLPDVNVVASFDTTDGDNQPAITVRHPTGQGSAWYIATDLDSRARQSLMTTVLAKAGIKTPVLPAGVQRVLRGTTTFYLNHADHAVTVDGVELKARNTASRDAPPRPLTFQRSAERA